MIKLEEIEKKKGNHQGTYRFYLRIVHTMGMHVND